MRLTSAVVVIFALIFAPLAPAQQQPQAEVQQQYSEQLEVRIRNLDVVVNDEKGNAVRGLKKEDFIVLENGVEQEITNFAFYDSGVTVAPTFATTNEAAPEGVTEAPPPRRFLFFIDEMSIQGSARKKLKTHAAEIVRTMRPGDLATVVRPTGSRHIIQDYSGDMAEVQKKLDEAIDDCKIRMTSPAFAEFRAFRRAMETASNSHEVAAAKREFSDAETKRVHHRLGQIRALIATMSQEDGKKVFVLITSGISAQPGRAAYNFDEQMSLFEKNGEEEEQAKLEQDLTLAAAGGAGAFKAGMRADARIYNTRRSWAGMDRPDHIDFRSQIDDLARAAAADGVTIYALAPEIPLMLDMSRGADSRTDGSTFLTDHAAGQKVVPSEMLNQLLHYEGQTLTSLAEKTGGRWFRGVGAIDDTFRKMADDLHTYYSLAYRAQTDEKVIRRIQVKVRNRPKLSARTRTELIDRPQGREMADRVVAGLLVSHEENKLQMTVTTDEPTRRGRGRGRQYEIPIEVILPVERLQFFKVQDGSYRALVSVHYAAARENKELLSYGWQEQIIELSPQQFAQRGRGRFRYQSMIPAPRGKIRIALGIVDTSTKLSSLQTVAVDVR